MLKTTKEKLKDLIHPGDGHKTGIKDGSKVSADWPPDKLQRWLNPPDPVIAHETRHPGTGKWFIESKAFRWWKRKEKSASLLVRGERVFPSLAVLHDY